MEKKLAQAIREGDRESLGRFYEIYWKEVYLATYRLTRSEELSKDLVQDAFVRLWEKRESIDEKQGALPLLYTIIKNNFINHIRREALGERKLDMLSERGGTTGTDPHDQLVAQELGYRIETIYESMPPGIQKVWQLSRSENLSVSEIAALLHISPLTVKKQLSNALRLFRQRLDNA